MGICTSPSGWLTRPLTPSIYGDPTAAAEAPAAREGLAILHGVVARVARAGRLRVSVAHAVRLIAAAGQGATLSLLATPAGARDPKLSAALRETALAAITTAPASAAAHADAPGPGRVAARAVTLRAVLAEATPGVLSAAEAHLLGEWLDRLAAGAGG